MKKLLLIGAGHAHLYGLSQKQLPLLPKLNITLITPSRYQYYSGMFSGYAEGLYTEDEIRLDVKKITDAAGIELAETEAVSVDPHKKLVYCLNGDVLAYDMISFNMGSLHEESERIRPIKPNFRFSESIQIFRNKELPFVIGGGAAGIELALAVQAWRSKNGKKIPVSLISPEPLVSAKHHKKIKEICQSKGISLIPERAADVSSYSISTSTGKSFSYSDLLWLTGPKASPLYKQAELLTDKNGFLLVDSTLQSIQFPGIFGAGDCVALSKHPLLPKNGVYAVRQGEVLWQNIRNLVKGSSLHQFQPQKRYLSILSIGDEEGFLTYGKLHASGKTAWKIKQFIDRKYMNSF